MAESPFNKLKILVWNVQGIYNSPTKRESLNNLLITHNIDIAILTEWSMYRQTIQSFKHNLTEQNKSWHNPFSTFTTYQAHFTTTDHVILIKPNIPYTTVPLTHPQSSHQQYNLFPHASTININHPQHTLTLGAFYNSTHKNNKGKPNHLFHYFNQHPSPYQLYCGDLNIHHFTLGDQHCTPAGTHFVSEMEDKGLFFYNDPHLPTHNKQGHLDVLIGSANLGHRILSFATHPNWIKQYNIKTPHYPITFQYIFHDNAPPKQ